MKYCRIMESIEINGYIGTKWINSLKFGTRPKKQILNKPCTLLYGFIYLFLKGAKKRNFTLQ